jgi:cytochrome c
MSLHVRFQRARWLLPASVTLGAIFIGTFWVSPSIAADPQRGAQLFRNCVACHSLEPGRNMTGPSLAGVVGRKAGSLESFERYSPALKKLDITWSAETLDRYLASPAQFIPGNRMTFAGVKDAAARADLIAFLQQASSAQAAPDAGQGAPMGTMSGMGAQRRNMKEVVAKFQVKTIALCRDTYRVATADGDVAEFWEPNLRFITDSGDLGPAQGAPVILPAGMMGDRGSVFFAAPEEIGRFIQHRC